MGKTSSTGLLILGALTIAAVVGVWAVYYVHLAPVPPAEIAVAESDRDEEGAAEGDAEADDEEKDDEGDDDADAKAMGPQLSKQPWDVVQTEGEEGELVEVKYDAEAGWRMAGWRVQGIGLHGAPAFQVPARKWDEVPLFPCSDCHGKKREPDPRPRLLTEEHDDLIVRHGNERFWCSDCHGGKGMDYLLSRRGKTIDIDLSYLHCGECHSNQMEDWEFGVHGKRIGFHEGPRVLRTCTECHNAHRPQIPAHEPKPPPRVRANLRMFAPNPHAHPPVWERFGKGIQP